ncbi:MAG: hypothetical protein ABEI53_01955 [Candidatus Magasanikbacteria bacterium]
MRTLALFLTIFFAFSLLFPLTAFGANPIWNGRYDVDCNVDGACSLCDGLKVGVNIITFIRDLALAVGTLMAAAGAVMIMAAGANESWYNQGKDMIKNAIIGIAIVLSSWLIINLFINILGGASPNPLSEGITC